jgi:hypothetical protein
MGIDVSILVAGFLYLGELMATVTVSNIIIGPATLKIDGVDVGAVSGGVAIAKSTDTYPVEVDNVRAAVKIVPVKENFSVKTNLAEATLNNLRVIWNIPASKLSMGVLQLGLSTGLVEHTLEITGLAPNGLTRVYRTYRAISVRASEHAYFRNKETLLPVEFDILPDLTKAAGEELGTVTDYNF